MMGKQYRDVPFIAIYTSSFSIYHHIFIDTLQQTNIAIDHGPFIR